MTIEQKRRRKEIKTRINALEKNNYEMFKLWCYKKNTIDDNSLREIARKNLVEIETLQNEYDGVKFLKNQTSLFVGQ